MPDDTKSDPAKPNDEDLKKAEGVLRVEQDDRVARVKAEAEDAKAGETSKKGVNPDG